MSMILITIEVRLIPPRFKLSDILARCLFEHLLWGFYDELSNP